MRNCPKELEIVGRGRRRRRRRPRRTNSTRRASSVVDWTLLGARATHASYVTLARHPIHFFGQLGRAAAALIDVVVVVAGVVGPANVLFHPVCLLFGTSFIRM